MNVYYFSLLFFVQSVTTLFLRGNQIGDGGTQYVANALKTNEVSYTEVPLSLSQWCLSYLDTDHFGS